MDKIADDILTLAEVADYLKISDKTLLKMVNKKEIPCAKIANQWRFSRAMINDWLTSKMEVLPQNDLSRLIEKQYDFVPISRLIDEENIILNLESNDREGVINELADKAFSSKLISNISLFKRKLLEREEITSTAIGNGIAIPHTRIPSAEVVNEPKIVIGFSKKGIDFNSHDGDITSLFFLLISDSEAVHLRVLSRLSRILKEEGSIAELKTLNTKKEIIGFFVKREQDTLI